MSTIRSSSEHLTLNADGAGKEVKIQRNGTQVLATSSSGIDVTGSVTADGLTVDGSAVIHDDNSFSGANGQVVMRISPSVSTSENAGIVFGTYNDIGYASQGIFWKRTGSYGVGDLHFCNRSTSDSTPVSITDSKLTITSTGNVEVSTGNVALGGTLPDWKSNYAVLQLNTYGALSTNDSPTTNVTTNTYYDATISNWKYQSTNYSSQYYQYGGQHVFRVAPSGTADTAISWTTAMTIANDGKTTIAGGSATSGIDMYAVNGIGQLKIGKTYSGSTHAVIFKYNNTTVGTIGYTNSSTSYNTSSDYRLKENVTPMSGSIDRLKQLKPSRFNFISDADTTVDGFLAHEAGEVVPEAISGTKDAMKTEEYEVTPEVKDDDGNVTSEAVMGEHEVPDMQGIDQSKLVPLLVGAIQELTARLEALENK